MGWKRTHRASLGKRVLAGSGGAEQERPENVPHASEHSPAWQKCQRSATWHYEDIVFVAREPVTTSHVGGAAKGTAGQRLSAKQRTTPFHFPVCTDSGFFTHVLHPFCTTASLYYCLRRYFINREPAEVKSWHEMEKTLNQRPQPSPLLFATLGPSR